MSLRRPILLILERTISILLDPVFLSPRNRICNTLDVPENPHELLAGDRLTGDQVLGQLVHRIPVSPKQAKRLLVGLL